MKLYIFVNEIWHHSSNTLTYNTRTAPAESSFFFFFKHNWSVFNANKDLQSSYFDSGEATDEIIISHLLIDFLVLRCQAKQESGSGGGDGGLWLSWACYRQLWWGASICFAARQVTLRLSELSQHPGCASQPESHRHIHQLIFPDTFSAAKAAHTNHPINSRDELPALQG